MAVNDDALAHVRGASELTKRIQDEYTSDIVRAWDDLQPQFEDALSDVMLGAKDGHVTWAQMSKATRLAKALEAAHTELTLLAQENERLIIRDLDDGELEPELRFNTSENAEKVSDPMERVIQPSWEWQLGRHGQTNVMITAEALGAPCTCKFCTEHANLHPAKTLTTVTGEDVQVDEELHGLLEAMNAAGIRTTGSCINFSDGLDQFAPERKPIFMKAPEGALNYRDVLIDKAAYIRMNNQDTRTQAFLQFAAKLPGVKVTEYHIMSQMVFPQERIPQLTVLARNVKRAADQAKAKKPS